MTRPGPLWALCRKELRSTFFSPVFYGTGAFFLFALSFRLYYLRSFFTLDSAGLGPFFSGFPLVYILVVPAITMKTWAEEKKLGTAEFLFTLPFSEGELCLGKYLAAFITLLIYLAATLPVPLSLLPLGNFDVGILAAEYAGAMLLGSSAVSLGLVFSAIAKNQAAAFLGCALALITLNLTDRLALAFNLPPALSRLLNFFSLAFHFESFSRGLLDTRDLAFFILSTALLLFLNTRLLLFRKWT